jgi:enamine deaminase RidA (YjgF/YER057c/UK114 family)
MLLPDRAVRVGEPPWTWAAEVQYSQAVRVGDLVFASGQGGFSPEGDVVPGGFETQLRQAFDNLEAALQTCGASLESVARMNVYVIDPADYAIFKRVRSDMLQAPYPASTAVCVAALLVDGMLVELDAVATAGGQRQQAHL